MKFGNSLFEEIDFILFEMIKYLWNNYFLIVISYDFKVILVVFYFILI